MRKIVNLLKQYKSEILIFSFLGILSCLVTYPLILRMGSYLYGEGGDALGGVWYFWWLKYAHIHRLSSDFCHLIAYPYGVDLAYMPLRHFLWEGLLLPVSLRFGEVFAYNFSVLPSFFFSAIIVYYLVHYFTKNKLANLIAGIIYTFCPFHFTHTYQHLTLANIQWIPLFFLALFNLDEKRTYGSAVLAALAFSLVFLSDYYYGYFITIFVGVFILWRIWFGLKRRKISSIQHPASRIKDQGSKPSLWKTFRVVLVAVMVALAIILPAIYPILKNVFSPKTEAMASLGYERTFSGLFTYSAQFFHYLIPSADNPFIGGFTRNFIKVYHPVEQTLYLGWVGIFLSLAAIREWRRKNREQVRKWEGGQVRGQRRLSGHQVIRSSGETDRSPITDYRSQRAVSFFLFAGIVALIFSHAPWTDIGSFRIFFPSYFLYKIAPMFRCYARFGILVMLSVSVLAGIGLADILQKIKTPKRRGILVALIVLLVSIEFAPTFPAPMINAVDPPPVYERLSKQEGDFIIAEYPLENDVEYLFWQRIHQKRLVNGALPGTHADKVRKEIVDILDPKTPGILKHLEAKYVIFHPEKYAKSKEVTIIGEIPDIKKQPGLKLIKSFPEAEVYEVMALPIKPEVNRGGRGTKDE